jgi:isoleucyl-tRNA synthetase
VPDVSAFSSYSFKPQLKTVGPKYGKLLGKIKNALAELDGNAAMDELTATGFLTFDFDGEEVKLANEDLLIEVEQKDGYFSVADMGITVAIDTNLTEELIEEGFVRELISKIQTMRKDSDFAVTDHIAVAVTGSDKISAIMAKYADEIIVLSQSVQDYFREVYHRETVLIPNGVEPGELRAAEQITREFGLDSRGYLLFFVFQ